MLKFLFWWFWPIRWARATLFAFKGVRLAPTTLLLGSLAAYKLGQGTKIGARTRLIAHNQGQIAIGMKAWISADVEIETSTSVRVGDQTTLQRRVSLNGSVRVGRYCLLAPNVFISSTVHAYDLAPHLPIREQEALLAQNPQLVENIDRPVWIQDDCWLGVNAFVGPGVTIGRGSVVGANAVVMRDVEPYSIVMGVPAQLIDHRLEWVPGHLIDPHNDKHRPYVLSGEWLSSQNGGVAKIRITPDEPLLAALDPTCANGKITIGYKSSCDVQIEINGERQNLASRENVLTLPPTALTVRHNAVLVSLKIVDGTTDKFLDILQIEAGARPS